MVRLLTIAVLALGLGLAVGCLDPCDQLATRICDCKSSNYDRDICRQRVELQKANRDPSDADKTACEAALKTCTCAAIDRLDLSQCGFARPAR
ncbi:MAG: hypothetical protein ABIJ09_15215 [Pseudomonadota bacterium]